MGHTLPLPLLITPKRTYRVAPTVFLPLAFIALGLSIWWDLANPQARLGDLNVRVTMFVLFCLIGTYALRSYMAGYSLRPDIIIHGYGIEYPAQSKEVIPWNRVTSVSIGYYGIAEYIRVDLSPEIPQRFAVRIRNFFGLKGSICIFTIGTGVALADVKQTIETLYKDARSDRVG